jgi:predicted Zn-dependent protease
MICNQRHSFTTKTADGADGLLGRAVAHLYLGQPAEAEKLLRAAVRLSPELAVAHAYLGAALLAQGKERAARRALERAVRLDPSNFVVRTQRARYFLAGGRYREAFIELAVALWRAPDPGSRQLVRDLLRQILANCRPFWDDQPSHYPGVRLSGGL